MPRRPDIAAMMKVQPGFQAISVVIGDGERVVRDGWGGRSVGRVNGEWRGRTYVFRNSSGWG